MLMEKLILFRLILRCYLCAEGRYRCIYARFSLCWVVCRCVSLVVRFDLVGGYGVWWLLVGFFDGSVFCSCG